MEQSIKMDQGMNPGPYYTKCCQMEDLMHEAEVAINRLNTGTERMMTECVNNRGQPDTAYSEIAADLMIQKLQQVIKAIG